MARDEYSDIFSTSAIEKRNQLIDDRKRWLQTDAGRAHHEGCMDWLRYCGTLPAGAVPSVEDYRKSKST